MSPRLWIDVEDLFEYVRTNYRRPTGIQRLAFEVYRELQARYGNTGQVYFVQHSLTGNGFQVVTWQEIAALFTGLVSDDAASGSARYSRTCLCAFARAPDRSPAGLPVVAVTAHQYCRCVGDPGQSVALLGQGGFRPGRGKWRGCRAGSRSICANPRQATHPSPRLRGSVSPSLLRRAMSC